MKFYEFKNNELTGRILDEDEAFTTYLEEFEDYPWIRFEVEGSNVVGFIEAETEEEAKESLDFYELSDIKNHLP